MCGGLSDDISGYKGGGMRGCGWLGWCVRVGVGGDWVVCAGVGGWVKVSVVLMIRGAPSHVIQPRPSHPSPDQNIQHTKRTHLEEGGGVPAVRQHEEHQEDVLRRVQRQVRGQHGLADLFWGGEVGWWVGGWSMDRRAIDT